MLGIDLNEFIVYKHSSFRFFDAHEHHVSRICEDDVLLLVFQGVLRFSEDGRQYELHPGEYYIQRRNTPQGGEVESDSPQYLYVHFLGKWADCGTALSSRGNFDYIKIKPMMEKLNRLSHQGGTLIERMTCFYEILCHLYENEAIITLPGQIAGYISRNLTRHLTLEMLSKEFGLSKNHIINIFKEEFHITPFAYMNQLRIKQAEQLLEITSQSAESICYECGFNNYTHFYKLFLRANGVSPTAWRKNKRVSPVPRNP